MIDPKEGQTGYDIREVYDDKTGLLRMRQIRLMKSGRLHSPPNDDPSHAAEDKLGRPLLFEWHRDGLDHREDGPSTIDFNPENGVHILEVYSIDGLPREPAKGYHIIRRDAKTGKVTEQLYDDQWHSDRPRKPRASNPSP